MPEIPAWMLSTFTTTKQSQTALQWRTTLATVPADIRTALDKALAHVPHKDVRGPQSAARERRLAAFQATLATYKIGRDGGTINVRRFIDAQVWGATCATAGHWSPKSEGGRFAAAAGLTASYVMEESPDDADTYIVSIKLEPLTAEERAYAAAIEEARLLTGKARRAHPAMKSRSAKEFAQQPKPFTGNTVEPTE